MEKLEEIKDKCGRSMHETVTPSEIFWLCEQLDKAIEMATYIIAHHDDRTGHAVEFLEGLGK